VAEREDCPEDPTNIPGDIALYSFQQTDAWLPPAAVGGLVPKNDYGNVDLYGNALPPPGTVHINLPRIGKTAKLMNIDYAPALVGFEYKAGGKTLPVFDGIVICEEFKDSVMEKYEEAEEARRVAIEAKIYKDACLKWRLLLGAMWTRRYLREEFQGGDKEDRPLNPTAARLAAAKAMNDAATAPKQASIDARSARAQTIQNQSIDNDVRSAFTLGATAFVEEL
jgi:xeroderma pigmentosum group C-complementing protein